MRKSSKLFQTIRAIKRLKRAGTLLDSLRLGLHLDLRLGILWHRVDERLFSRTLYLLLWCVCVSSGSHGSAKTYEVSRTGSRHFRGAHEALES